MKKRESQSLHRNRLSLTAAAGNGPTIRWERPGGDVASQIAVIHSNCPGKTLNNRHNRFEPVLGPLFFNTPPDCSRSPFGLRRLVVYVSLAAPISQRK